MTDFTTDMTPQPRERQHGQRREFYAYFALIFMATLPLALLTWALSALRRMEWPDRGPIARAWRQASIITPQIFSA